MDIEIGKLKIIPRVVKDRVFEYNEGPVHRFEDNMYNLEHFFKEQYNEKLGDYTTLSHGHAMTIALFGNVILYIVETKTTHYIHDRWLTDEEIIEEKEFYIYMPNFCSGVQIEYINEFFNELKTKGINRGVAVILTPSETKGGMKEEKRKKGSINEVKRFISINSNYSEENERLQEKSNIKKLVKKPNNN